MYLATPLTTPLSTSFATAMAVNTYLQWQTGNHFVPQAMALFGAGNHFVPQAMAVTEQIGLRDVLRTSLWIKLNFSLTYQNID